MKLSPVRGVVEGKRVIMVDDSIVRGTTSRRIVRMLKDAGATEVHVVISSPPIKNPCFYGIDTSSKEELIASDKSVEEIREIIGADSLTFIKLEGMIEAIGKLDEGETAGFCLGCFTGKYPTEIYPDTTLQYYYPKIRRDHANVKCDIEQAGVNIEAGYEAVTRMKKHVQKTARAGVLGGLGGFGGMFDLSAFKFKGACFGIRNRWSRHETDDRFYDGSVMIRLASMQLQCVSMISLSKGQSHFIFSIILLAVKQIRKKSKRSLRE